MQQIAYIGFQSNTAGPPRTWLRPISTTADARTSQADTIWSALVFSSREATTNFFWQLAEADTIHQHESQVPTPQGVCFNVADRVYRVPYRIDPE